MGKRYGVFMFGLLAVVFCLVAAAVHAFVKPFINPELGDVVLFVFALAGAGSGFIAGHGLQRMRARKPPASRNALKANSGGSGDP